jgi:Barstar (barnase inhibitor)
MKDSPFYFGDVTRLCTSDDFVAELPEGITTKVQLLEAYYVLLKFPEYFGFNWDAMEECLRDFHWIKNRRVIIVHKALPRLEHSQIKIYLDILANCVRDWKEGEAHSIVVAFPEGLEQLVNSLLETRSDST